MIQATTSFYKTLWDYWGVIIHEEENTQLRDGIFKGLDRALRAYLNSLTKFQAKKTQDVSASDPDLMDPRDRLIQSQREIIERQNGGIKRACELIAEGLYRSPPEKDVNANAQNDPSRRESYELEEPHEKRSEISKKTIKQLHASPSKCDKMTESELPKEMQKINLQLDAHARGLRSVETTVNSMVEKVDRIVDQLKKNEEEKMLRVLKKKYSEINFDRLDSSDSSSVKNHTSGKPMTAQIYLDKATKIMERIRAERTELFSRPGATREQESDGDSEEDDFSCDDESTREGFSRPPGQDRTNLDLRKMHEPKELNPQIPNYLKQYQGKEDGEFDATEPALSFNQELKPDSSGSRRSLSSSRNSVHSGSWGDDDDWGPPKMHGAQ
ncbi:uncharacterized protein N7483_003132 [Penicillium malachiteum]|uniref:uncharacterized protein n=1 Tax=Penicillium malachiteum TaxID=1324776 RepID=UPI002546D089|nr:uncharacterized protein N7483_003132 [Penicillium malachiteum]KAJ5728624.1 hypothetical protein N7483_003132 [Penicillium malachiteum]